MKLEFSIQLKKYTQISTSMNIIPAETEFFFMRTDRWTDMMTLIVAFRSFAKAPTNDSFTVLMQL